MLKGIGPEEADQYIPGVPMQAALVVGISTGSTPQNPITFGCCVLIGTLHLTCNLRASCWPQAQWKSIVQRLSDVLAASRHVGPARSGDSGGGGGEGSGVWEASEEQHSALSAVLDEHVRPILSEAVRATNGPTH
jgi:hypothetical protein